MSQFNFQAQPKNNTTQTVLIVATVVAVLSSLVSAGALVVVLLRGSSVGPDPAPVPVDVASVMEQAERTRLVMEADAAEELGRKIASGEVKNSNQLYTWAKAYQDKIDETAYAEVNKLNQQVLAERDAGWTQEQIQQIEQFQRDKAEGKRRVAK